MVATERLSRVTGWAGASGQKSAIGGRAILQAVTRVKLELALIHEGETQKGDRNRATLAVARKMIAYLLPWIAENAGSCLHKTAARQRLKPPLREKRSQDYTVRRLPGPAVGRLSEGDHTPEAPFGLFRDWQRTQTQSSVKAPPGPRQQIDVWFCEGRNQRREAHVASCGF